MSYWQGLFTAVAQLTLSRLPKKVAHPPSGYLQVDETNHKLLRSD